MNFEEYVKEEFKKTEKKIDDLSGKVDKLMIFMAVEKAETSKKNKSSAMIVGGLISFVVSIATAIASAIIER